MAAMLTRAPAPHICKTVIRPVPKTMALGGVATGSMKAQPAASAVGTAKAIGSKPRETPTAAATGTKTAAVALLLVNSVR